MTAYTLKLNDKISFKLASDKIYAFAMFSDHNNQFRPKSGKELGQWLREKDINPNEIIEQCRDPKQSVPIFESITCNTWRASPFPGGSIAITEDNEVISEVKNAGILVMSNSIGHFEAACSARDRAIKENNLFSLYEALSQGLASIEALLNYAAEKWNKSDGVPELSDSHEHKVSIETKLNEWVPIITFGGRIDKSGRIWSDFKRLKKLRDEEAIHPSSSSRGVDYKSLAKNINDFRYGIAFLLGNLHVTFKMHVPAVIINAIYYPDVVVHEDE